MNNVDGGEKNLPDIVVATKIFIPPNICNPFLHSNASFTLGFIPIFLNNSIFVSSLFIKVV
jgi:hypothetical protein